jgi:hypothetical protein
LSQIQAVIFEFAEDLSATPSAQPNEVFDAFHHIKKIWSFEIWIGGIGRKCLRQNSDFVAAPPETLPGKIHEIPHENFLENILWSNSIGYPPKQFSVRWLVIPLAQWGRTEDRILLSGAGIFLRPITFHVSHFDHPLITHQRRLSFRALGSPALALPNLPLESPVDGIKAMSTIKVK